MSWIICKSLERARTTSLPYRNIENFFFSLVQNSGNGNQNQIIITAKVGHTIASIASFQLRNYLYIMVFSVIHYIHSFSSIISIVEKIFLSTKLQASKPNAKVQIRQRQALVKDSNNSNKKNHQLIVFYNSKLVYCKTINKYNLGPYINKQSLLSNIYHYYSLLILYYISISTINNYFTEIRKEFFMNKNLIILFWDLIAFLINSETIIFNTYFLIYLLPINIFLVNESFIYILEYELNIYIKLFLSIIAYNIIIYLFLINNNNFTYNQII